MKKLTVSVVVFASCMAMSYGAISVLKDPGFKPEEQAAFEKRGVERGNTVTIAITNGFDVGKTVFSQDGKTKQKHGDGRWTNSCTWVVPPCEYVAARIRFSLDPDPKKDRAVVLRLTRYVDGGDWTRRAFHGTCNTLVETDKIAKREIGHITVDGVTRVVYEADVAIDMGDLIGILHDERRGTFLWNSMNGGPYYRTDIGNYLDFDILGRLVRKRGSHGDERLFTDVNKVSAVRMHAVVLRKAPAELRVKQLQPGNVFHNDEKPVTKAFVDVKEAGSYTLSWKVKDADGKVVARDKRTVTESAEFDVDLAQKELGWYELVYTLSDGKHKYMTHHASFVLLDKDTRTTGIGEGPYGTWTYGGNHYCSYDIDFVGPLMLKAGFRRGEGLTRLWKPEQYHRYKLSPQTVEWPNAKTDEERVAAIRKQLETDPNTRAFLMFHENAPWPYQQAPELTGDKYGPRYAWDRGGKRDPEKDRVEATNRVALAKSRCGFLRKHFPEIYILLGNSLASTELIGELVRNGFPEEYADYMGIETVVRNSKPERQWEGTIQSADLMMQTAENLGYKKWRVDSTFESDYRIEDLIGPKRHASWYVRDILVSQCWRMPDIFIGVLTDTGNNYTSSFWGESGLCRGMPYCYPRRAYAGIAVATRMLDNVTDAKRIDCGDPCVFVVDYARKDGSHVWAMWTSRGTAEVAFKLDEDVEMTDFYGRKFEPARDAGSFFSRCLTKKNPVVLADGFVRYFKGPAGAVISAKVGKRTYPDDVQPADARLVKTTDNAAEWKACSEVNPAIERKPGPFLPFRTAGKCAVRNVVDKERGKCIELELTEPNMNLAKTVSEYAIIELEKPVPLTGDPASIGTWVKGNSGWGNFCWIVENAQGQRFYSFGGSANADCFDYDGTVSVDFTGWAFLKMALSNDSTVENTSLGSPCGGSWVGAGDTPGRTGLKLVGLALVAQNRPLSLTTRAPYPQKIRISGVYTFD